MQPMFFWLRSVLHAILRNKVNLLSPYSRDLLKHFQYTETPGGYNSCYFLVSFPYRGINGAVRYPVASARAPTDQGVGDIFLFKRLVSISMVLVFETYTRLMRERVLSGCRFWYRLQVFSNFITIEWGGVTKAVPGLLFLIDKSVYSGNTAQKTDQLVPRDCTSGRNFCVGMALGP